METLKFRTLSPEEIAVRPGNIIYDPASGDPASIQLILHIKNRETCSIRLDETVGTDRWQDSFITQGASPICSVSIYFPEKGWVTKSDTGENPMGGLSLKPAFSDAFKRACYKWGIGRELFFLPEFYASPKDFSQLLRDGENKVIGFHDKIVVNQIEVREGKPVLVVLYNKTTGKFISCYDIRPAEERETDPVQWKVADFASWVPRKTSTDSDTKKKGNERVPRNTPVRVAADESSSQTIKRELNAPKPAQVVSNITSEEASPIFSPVSIPGGPVHHETTAMEVSYEDAMNVIADCGAYMGRSLSEIAAKSPSGLTWLWSNTSNSEVKGAIAAVAKNNEKVNMYFIEKGIAV